MLVFFGLVPVCMTYWLTAPPTPLTTMPLSVMLLSLACGLVIDTLLVVNNYRDIDNDRRAGKRTLIVRIGARAGLLLYLSLGVLAVLIIVGVMCVAGFGALWLSALYIPFHCAAFIEMRRIGKGAELNRVLGMTARNMLVYGLLVSVGLLLS